MVIILQQKVIIRNQARWPVAWFKNRTAFRLLIPLNTNQSYIDTSYTYINQARTKVILEDHIFLLTHSNCLSFNRWTDNACAYTETMYIIRNRCIAT